MIDAYSFGRMIIGGKDYTSDLIILPDRIIDTWWRKSGHLLCLEDLGDILREDFEALVVGTGYLGIMKVKPEVVRHAESRGWKLFIAKTRKAVDAYNKLQNRTRTVGAFHLTC